MKAQEYPTAVLELISALKRMPGVGSRGAERLALWFLQQGRQDARSLAAALVQAADTVSTCPECGFFSPNGETCAACSDDARDTSLLCVVEQPTDVLPIERSGAFRGLYHCLGGKISPLDGVMPEDLSIEKLLERVRNRPGCEVVLAVGSDVEGEATALYLANQLAPLDCRVSRIAQGMPAGAGLSHADAVTLMRAMQGRKSMGD
ncbi:MAG: recombination mediator RecR [Akkermansia sp.]|nr:recombination mediator RecR [Akkermansia sp.]